MIKCEECLPLIERYFDGDLDGPAGRRVATHLAACAACAARCQELSDEQDLYLRHECDAEVTPDFWQGVLQSVREEKTARAPRPLPRLLRDGLDGAMRSLGAPRFSAPLTAAIVIAAVVITAGLMKYTGTREPADPRSSQVAHEGAAPAPSARPAAAEAGSGGDSDPVAERPAADEGGRRGRPARAGAWSERDYRPPSHEGARAGARAAEFTRRAPTPDQLVREAEQKYLAAIRILSRDVNRRSPRIDPDTLARFEQTLAAVDRTIAGTRRAVREHPGDPVAVQYMLTAYARKVDLLREMVGP